MYGYYKVKCISGMDYNFHNGYPGYSWNSGYLANIFNWGQPPPAHTPTTHPASLPPVPPPQLPLPLPGVSHYTVGPQQTTLVPPPGFSPEGLYPQRFANHGPFPFRVNVPYQAGDLSTWNYGCNNVNTVNQYENLPPQAPRDNLTNVQRKHVPVEPKNEHANVVNNAPSAASSSCEDNLLLQSEIAQKVTSML